MKIPIYNASKQLGAPKITPVVHRVKQDAWPGAIKGSIDALAERHAEIEYERDEMDVVKALGKLGDAERLYLAEEEARPLTEVSGTLKRGGEWYKESVRAISGELRSKNAQEIFQMKAEPKRANGLNRLAGHMAQQHRVQKKHELEGMQANLFSDINIGMTPEQLDQGIRDLNVKIKGYYKGANTDAIKLNAKTALINAYLKDAAISKPELIPGLIKRYDKDLSEQDAKSIKDIALKSLTGIEIGDIYDDIKSLYKDDPTGALAAAYNMKVTDAPPGVVNTVRNLLKDEFATFGNFQAASQKKVQAKAEVGAINYWATGNYVALRRHVMGQMIDPGRVEHWLDKLDKAEKAIKDDGDNPYEKSDPAMRAQIAHIVMTAPHTLSNDVIWDLNGSGLSTKDCEKFSKIWEDRSVKGANPKEVEVANILTWYRKNNEFDADDMLENNKIHDALLSECFIWSASNPEGDVVEYMTSKLKELEGQTWWTKTTEAFAGFFSDSPGIDDAPVAPVLPGDLEDMVGWGHPDPPPIRTVIDEDPSHKAKRLLDRALDKYNKEK